MRSRCRKAWPTTRAWSRRSTSYRRVTTTALLAILDRAHPPDTGPHHYHFQMFALDAPLTLNPESADLRALVDAMKGRVLADGELVGVFEAPNRQ